MPCARCSRGEISQKMQLSGSLPSWSGSLVSHRKTSRDLEEYTMSGRLRPHTHIPFIILALSLNFIYAYLFYIYIHMYIHIHIYVYIH